VARHCLNAVLNQYSPEVLHQVTFGNLDVQELLRALESAEELSEEMDPEDAVAVLQRLVLVAYVKGYHAQWLAAHATPCAEAG
jgi:hypothetical protein